MHAQSKSFSGKLAASARALRRELSARGCKHEITIRMDRRLPGQGEIMRGFVGHGKIGISFCG